MEALCADVSRRLSRHLSLQGENQALGRKVLGIALNAAHEAEFVERCAAVAPLQPAFAAELWARVRHALRPANAAPPPAPPPFALSLIHI